jgi:putative spermidine/putrescine transport system ATP-binding protein
MYGSPATPFVAEFIGTMNRLVASVADDGAIDYNGLVLRVDAARGLPRGERVLCLIRPETVEIVAENGTTPEGALAGEVISNTFLGSTSRVRVADEANDRTLTADISTARAAPLTVGTRAVASFPPDSPRLLSLAGETEPHAPDPDSL